jgi:hypothetical protein
LINSPQEKLIFHSLKAEYPKVRKIKTIADFDYKRLDRKVCIARLYNKFQYYKPFAGGLDKDRIVHITCLLCEKYALIIGKRTLELLI